MLSISPVMWIDDGDHVLYMNQWWGQLELCIKGNIVKGVTSCEMSWQE